MLRLIWERASLYLPVLLMGVLALGTYLLVRNTPVFGPPAAAKPIRMTDNQVEYRVIPNARGPAAAEVYSVDRVTAISASGQEREFLPFFQPNHPPSSDQKQGYWYAKRMPAIGKAVAH